MAIMQLIQEQLERATLHSACDSTLNVFAEQLLLLHTSVSHHALVEQGKNKTVRNIKSLKTVNWYCDSKRT